MRHIKEHPRREEFIALSKQSTFYGVPIADLDKEDLLMMIGMLGREKAREAELRHKERKLARGDFGAFSRAR